MNIEDYLSPSHSLHYCSWHQWKSWQIAWCPERCFQNISSRICYVWKTQFLIFFTKEGTVDWKGVFKDPLIFPYFSIRGRPSKMSAKNLLDAAALLNAHLLSSKEGKQDPVSPKQFEANTRSVKTRKHIYAIFFSPEDNCPIQYRIWN